MSRSKVVIFILIAGVFVIFIVSPFLSGFFNRDQIKDLAKEQSLAKGDYIAGEDIEPGYYDVVVMEGEVIFNGIQLSNKDKLLGQVIYDNSHTIVDGKGTIKMTPAGFESLSLNNQNEIVIEHSGNYIVGEQIPEGNYLLKYTVVGQDNEEVKKPFIQILNGFEGEIIESYEFEKNDHTKITLKNEQVLEVHKSLFQEYENIIITLVQQ
ncbi:hypothetical protein [Ornithinibacillus contaminans]|uniref:hypothetical protein n=1 Tax=Ornithinibacillus contaminans TaxID=694055 RepID=UPI00064DB9EF|nr:hypothetical protein [Ornithinibacillus contaminans]